MADAEAVANVMASTIGSQAKMIAVLQVELQESKAALADWLKAEAQPAHPDTQEGSQ